MEKYTINRNTPKAEAYELISLEADELYRSVVLVEDEEGITPRQVILTIPPEKRTGILVGDVICFRKRSGTSSNKKEWGVYGEAPVTVLAIDGDNVTVDIPEIDDVPYIISTDGDDGLPGTIHLKENLYFLPEDFEEFNDQNLSITATTQHFEYDDTSIVETLTLRPVYRKYDSYGTAQYDYDPNYDRTNINTLAFGTGKDDEYWKQFTVPSEMTAETTWQEYTFPLEMVTDINRFFYKKDDKYVLFKSVDVVKEQIFYEIKTQINVSDENNLLQQNTITDMFSLDIKEKVIPDFVDMEKSMYEPVINSASGTLCNEIIFKFNFRVRDLDDKAWPIKDNMGWNQYGTGDPLPQPKEAVSDPLSVLNFTKEDVQFQKMRLKKSFIRLSFYDTDNPLTQQLLYYSTVFLDSGELFGEFTKGRYSDPNFDVTSLSTEMTIRNRYQSEKSSEGFYIYLFTNETEKDGPSKDIYMKVEFNHAGYGRVIPMVKPHVENGVIQATPFEEYFSSQFIKLSIKSMQGADADHIYYVTDTNQKCVEVDGETIIFNLFEAKIKD